MVLRGASVEPGRFNTIGERTVWVDERRDRRLRGIVIADRSDPERPFVVFAESGEMELDEERAEFLLRLERGDVHIEGGGSEERYQRLTFERFEYRFDVDALVGNGGSRRPREMELDELRETVKRIEAGAATGSLREVPASYPVHLQQRWAMPMAPALFALVGVPLGMQRKRGARSWGVILCAVLAFGYYALQSFGELLAIESGFPPAIVWMPNVIYGALGVVLLTRAHRAS